MLNYQRVHVVPSHVTTLQFGSLPAVTRWLRTCIPKCCKRTIFSWNSCSSWVLWCDQCATAPCRCCDLASGAGVSWGLGKCGAPQLCIWSTPFNLCFSLLLLFGVVFFWSHCFFAVAIVKSDRTNTQMEKLNLKAQFFQVRPGSWLILVTGKEPLKHFDLWSQWPKLRGISSFWTEGTSPCIQYFQTYGTI